MIRVLGVVACVAISGSQASAEVVSIVSDRDATLYQDDLGGLANGSGQWMFAGTTAMERLRRAVLRFDVAGSVPAGAIITGASVRLNMDRGISGGAFMTLHKVSSNWGEGASVALGEQGAGGDPMPGDATWIHTSFPSGSGPGTLWNTPGGDFRSSLSAIQLVSDVGAYSWANDLSGTNATMIADVQSMLDAPGGNFGWLLMGDEFSVPPTAKRFWTREAPEAINRPTLVIEYTVPGIGTGAAAVGAMMMTLGRRRRSVRVFGT